MAQLTVRNEIGDYADGGEAELLRIIGGATDRSSGSAELGAAIHDWVTRYHLSTMRPNVLRPLTLAPGSRILEVGAGTGVLTRWLGEQGHRVVAVEGALARAEVIAARCAELDNVEVICGSAHNAADHGPFDVVTLIGVLEYAGVKGLPDAHSLLSTCASLLTEGGVLVVAIENQFGLQYLGGANEDHRGIPGVGIEGYLRPGARTYHRRGLGELVGAHGLVAQRWLYPFPDYKLPSSVLSHHAFDASHEVPTAAVVALARRLRSVHLNEGPATFDLAAAFGEAVDAGWGAEISNSFLLVAGRSDDAVATSVDPEVVAWLYGDERRPRWSRRRTVRAGEDGLVVDAAGGDAEHVDGWLRQRVPGTRPFRLGRDLLTLAVEACRRGDGIALDEVLATWQHALDASAIDRDGGAEHPFRTATTSRFLAADRLDLDLGNFVIDDDGAIRYIDDEWIASSPVDRDLVSLRALWGLARVLVEEGCAFPGSPELAMDELALLLASRAGVIADGSTLAAMKDAEAALQRLVVVANDAGIDAWLDGSQTVRARVEAGLATASRSGEALLDAWRRTAALEARLAQAEHDRDTATRDLAAATTENARLQFEWHTQRAQIATLEEHLHRLR